MRKLKKYKPTRFMAEDSHYDKAEADFAVNFIENLCHTKGTSFIMNDATLAQVRKLKDNNGQYLWQPSYQAGEPDKILGYEVHTSAFAPTDAIAFGDYSYYNIGDRGTRSFKQLNELFAGNGMIGFVAKERVDGLLILPEAVKVLKLKAETQTASTKA